MTDALAIRDLAKRFGEVQAVAGVSLSVREGEVYGLIGPDGAGKTTTMRMVAGLLLPDRGSIEAFDLAVPRDVGKLRRVMGYMPQKYSLYADLSVEENFRFFAGMYGVSRREMGSRQARLLGIARLDRFLDRPAGALSGGMYKKLALACALAHRPRLVLLDEPTNGVDPISRRELWSFLYELVHDGVTALVSTPYMDEAERFDRVGLLVGGRLVAEDSPLAMRRAFQNTVFEIETAAQTRAREALAGAPGVASVYTVGKKLHAVSPEGPDFGERIRERLGGSGVEVASVAVVSASFEDIFLGLASARGARAEGPDARP